MLHRICKLHIICNKNVVKLSYTVLKTTLGVDFAYICGGPFEDEIFHSTMEIDNPRDGNFEDGSFHP